MIRKWDIKSEARKKKCIDDVLARIDEQNGSEFGMIAAQEIIDIVAMQLGPETYNSGIEDAKRLIKDKLSDIDVELDILKASS